MSPRDICTASTDRSIWLDLPEDTFRRHIVQLEERTCAVPVDPQVFNAKDWTEISKYKSENSYTLPIDVEQQLADDLACLIAVREGAQSVSAVCVEECAQPTGLMLRFAALDISLDNTIETTLQAIFDVLALSISNPTENSVKYVNMVFHHVITLHSSRLLARLRSVKWKRPKYLSQDHKKPLWQDFANLIHRTQFLYTKKEKSSKQLVKIALEDLCLTYQSFETSEDEIPSLMHLVEATFEFCSSENMKAYSLRLDVGRNPKPQIASAIKSLRQLKKIAAYRRICISLVNSARQYPTLFQSIAMAYVPPYKSTATSITYHNWATSCHVHAEIQLAVYYDLNPQYQPRCIGTSKWLCYLCYLFLQGHKRFFPSKTHGHLYDQWTVPDLIEFDDNTCQRYRVILKTIDNTILQKIETEVEYPRLEPMTSNTLV
jgi:hypothetical protein